MKRNGLDFGDYNTEKLKGVVILELAPTPSLCLGLMSLDPSEEYLKVRSESYDMYSYRTLWIARDGEIFVEFWNGDCREICELLTIEEAMENLGWDSQCLPYLLQKVVGSV